MALPENPKLHDLITRLQQCFSPIYAQWQRETAPTKPNSAEEMLSNDIISLGLFISAHDALSARLEKHLLAEMLTFIGPAITQMPYDFLLDSLDSKIATLTSNAVKDQQQPDIVTIALARNWVGENPERKVQAQTLVSIFSEIANEFIMYDGRISDAEIKFLDDFDRYFAIT